MELEFRKITFDDRDDVTAAFKMNPSRSCDRSFANVYLWARHYCVTMARIGGAYVFRSQGDPKIGTAFSMPAGETEECKKALKVLMEYCKEQKIPLKMYAITREDFRLLSEEYPGRFTIQYDRNDADYVYECEKLIKLSGKKYHAKRNYINRFIQRHPEWQYETITKDNVEDCFQMALKWRSENGCDDNQEKCNEMCVALNALRLIEELHLMGGLIRAEGRVVAFSIGEMQSSDTVVIHIEKAFSEVDGAYPIINQQFLIHEAGSAKYVNREEDTGAEGLRIAKESYHPAFMLEKGRAVFNDKTAEHVEGGQL